MQPVINHYVTGSVSTIIAFFCSLYAFCWCGISRWANFNAWMLPLLIDEREKWNIPLTLLRSILLLPDFNYWRNVWKLLIIQSVGQSALTVGPATTSEVHWSSKHLLDWIAITIVHQHLIDSHYLSKTFKFEWHWHLREGAHVYILHTLRKNPNFTKTLCTARELDNEMNPANKLDSMIKRYDIQEVTCLSEWTIRKRCHGYIIHSHRLGLDPSGTGIKRMRNSRAHSDTRKLNQRWLTLWELVSANALAGINWIWNEGPMISLRWSNAQSHTGVAWVIKAEIDSILMH